MRQTTKEQLCKLTESPARLSLATVLPPSSTPS
jgi:hypothetical protein